MPELKPCPFCGGTQILWSNNSSDGIVWSREWFICETCNAYGPDGENRKDAAAKWNRRAKDAGDKPCGICADNASDEEEDNYPFEPDPVMGMEDEEDETPA